MHQLSSTNRIANKSDARVPSPPQIGTSQPDTRPLIVIMPDSVAEEGTLTAPMMMLRIAARQYMNSGFMPKASKKRHQRRLPFISIIHIRRARNDDARPQVVSTNVGDHIFLLIGMP